MALPCFFTLVFAPVVLAAAGFFSTGVEALLLAFPLGFALETLWCLANAVYASSSKAWRSFLSWFWFAWLWLASGTEGVSTSWVAAAWLSKGNDAPLVVAGIGKLMDLGLGICFAWQLAKPWLGFVV